MVRLPITETRELAGQVVFSVSIPETVAHEVLASMLICFVVLNPAMEPA